MENSNIRTELIDKIANVLVSNDAGWITKAYLETFKPISTLGGIFIYIPSFLIFEMLGPWGHEFGKMLIDDPEENIDRIIKKIDELEQEKAQREESSPLLKDNPRIFPSIWRKLKKLGR